MHRIESGAHVYLSEKNENTLYIVLSGCVKIEVRRSVMMFSAYGLQALGDVQVPPVTRSCRMYIIVHVKDPAVFRINVFCRPSR